MITFFICVAILVGGYFTYGTIVDKILAPNDAILTPAKRLADGVDYVELPWWKVLLTQFLNIAGLGPIFGAILGALFGPVAFIWITFGCLFVGSVADMLVGFISMRHDGLSITELVGLYLGKHTQKFMIVFTFILLVLVGVTFTMAPANWLNTRIYLGSAQLAGVTVPWVWVLIIMAYYVFATVFPIETLMAKLFPPLSVMMLGACIILLIMLFFNLGSNGMGLSMMEFWDFPGFDLQPQGLTFFPFIFTTIACGAVSGFHATKSPMMARCIGLESEAKRVFFGSMIIEGIVALIWCALTLAFFGDNLFVMHTNAAGNAVTQVGLAGGQGGVVDLMATSFLPNWIATILIFSAVILFPVTSADTGFRSVRLMFADAFKWDQSKALNRLLVSIPIFVAAWALTWVDFGIIWRYFAWSNLSIAAIALWMGARYLATNKKPHWIATLPAVITSMASVAYILQAPEGFQWVWGGADIMGTASNIIGIVFGLVLLGLFLATAGKAPEKLAHLVIEEPTA